MLVSGPLRSNHIQFKVDQGDRAARVEVYAQQWLDGSSEERWRALSWLYNNELEAGDTTAHLLRLLGNPSSKRQNGDWVYSVNAIGLLVGVHDNRISRITTYVD